MPRTVEIDDDIYEFLRQNVRAFRETESTVLRRLLNLPNAKPPTLLPPPGARPSLGASPAGQPPPPVDHPSPLMRFVADLSFRDRNATDKFLGILGFAYKEDPARFEKVIEIWGRSRKYFGRSREEIEKSGTSTHPRPIPGSEYWVMTNADTRQKCDMLKRALKVLGYSAEDIQAADNAIF